MMDLVKTLFKANKVSRSPVIKLDAKRKPASQNLPPKLSIKKYEDLMLSPHHHNYGIEVKEISIVEFDRRKKPR